MAKTVTEWYDTLVQEKESMGTLHDLQPNINENHQPLLNELTTTSKVARWRLLVWLMAFGFHLHETILEMYADSTESGTPRWYHRKALEFQYGDPLEIINNTPQYATVNPANQIIKLVSVVEAPDGRVILKVSKMDTTGPLPLTSGEKTAFEAYVYEIKFAGTITTVISQAADYLKVGWRIYFDALVLNADGSRIDDNTIFPVNDAVNAFLSNMPYNGLLYLDDLTAVVRSAFGVKHAVLTVAGAKPYYSGTYTDITTPSDQKYNPEAGYMRISPVPTETLDFLNDYQPA